MDALVFKLSAKHDETEANLYIVQNDTKRWLASINGLALKDVEWLILANTSEHTTPFLVEVK